MQLPKTVDKTARRVIQRYSDFETIIDIRYLNIYSFLLQVKLRPPLYYESMIINLDERIAASKRWCTSLFLYSCFCQIPKKYGTFSVEIQE